MSTSFYVVRKQLTSLCPFVTSLLLLSYASLGTAQTQSTTPHSPSPPSPQSGTWGNVNTYYSFGALTVAILAIIIVTILFVLLLKYQHRLEQSGFLVDIYHDSVADSEYKRLAADVHERFSEGSYSKKVEEDMEWMNAHKKPPLPEIDLGGSRGGTLNPFRPPPGLRAGYLYAPEGADQSVVQAVRDYNEQRGRWEDEFAAETRRRYQNDLQDRQNKANKRADDAVKNVDFSALQGRGAEFVLGFTTIALIVFAALALGVLKILNSEQIGTLFAAIAGYVLGRASTRATSAAPVVTTGEQDPKGKQAKAAAAA